MKWGAAVLRSVLAGGLLAGSAAILEYSIPPAQVNPPASIAYNTLSSGQVAERQIRELRKEKKRLYSDAQVRRLKTDLIPLEYAYAATEAVLHNDPGSIGFERSRIGGMPEYATIGDAIVKAYKKGVTISQLRTLLTAQDPAGNRIFGLDDILKSDAPAEYNARCIQAIMRTRHGEWGTISAADIREFYNMKDTPEELQEMLKLADGDGEPLFSVQDITESAFPLRRLKEFISIRDGRGERLCARMLAHNEEKDSVNCAHKAIMAAKSAYAAGVKAERIREWVQRFDSGAGSSDIFDRILALVSGRGKHIEECADAAIGKKDVIGNPIDGAASYKYCALGLAPEEITRFTDTALPNALMDIPFSDHNGAFENTGVVNLVKTLKAHYDLGIIVAREMQDLERGVLAVPDSSLLILAGHGSPTDLELDTTRKPARNLSVKDDLYKVIHPLHPEAVIFLFSCRNAEGKNNLAKRVEEQAEGRRVIASTVPFSSTAINMNSAYPFDADIIVSFHEAVKIKVKVENEYITKRMLKRVEKDCTYKSAKASDKSRVLLGLPLVDTMLRYQIPSVPKCPMLNASCNGIIH